MGRLKLIDQMLINAWEMGLPVHIRFKDGREGDYKVMLFDVELLGCILQPAAGGANVRVLTDEMDEVALPDE
jgi:hypothetical protein